MDENPPPMICRTCLSSATETSYLFAVANFVETYTEISGTLMAFAAVQVTKGDGLPEQMCVGCLQELKRALLFKELCEKSDITLRSYLVTDSVVTEDKFDIEADIQLSSAGYFIPESTEGEKTGFSEILMHTETNHEASNEEKNEESNKSETGKRKKKSYSCEICNTTCYGLAGYRMHMTDEHGQTFKCNTCDKSFATKTILDRHSLIHETDEPVKKHTGTVKRRNLPRTCTICNKTFRFHSNLERHKLIHTGEKPFLCNVCGKGFAQLSYLKIHSFIHTGEKPYKCNMCDKSFSAPGTLMTHKRIHTGERPHICKICGKDFPQSGYLSAHIRTHTGEKPVECNVCHRRFNQSGCLSIHMRIHSGEKPYKCKDCGRCFAVKGTLNKHIRTHTGERPYICSVCGQTFAQSGTMVTHMKVHKAKT